MPSDNYPFAVGRIKIIENSLLGDSKLSRLSELGYAEALKQLNDWGFSAEYPDKTDVDALIDYRRKDIRNTVFDLTPNEGLTNLFWLEFDAINLKLFLKSRLLGGSDLVDASTLTGGVFEPTLIRDCVDTKKYEPLGEPLATSMNELEKRMKLSNDPRVLSALVDRAIFGYIFDTLKSNKNAFCLGYFKKKADFTNVTSLLRARALKWSASELSDMLIEGGSIDTKTVLSGLEAPADKLPKLFGGAENDGEIKAALAVYNTGSVNAAAELLERYLLETVKEERNDSFGIGPIANYLLTGEYECRALRRMFAKKRAAKTA